MAEFGHIKMSRKAYATDPWWNEPRDFSKWEAWEWMIQEAAYAPRRRLIAGTVVELNRGEVLASVRFLAKAWGWSVKRVRTWVRDGQTTGKIKAQREAQGGTVYLLVNYDTYQGGDTPEGTGEGTARAQQGHSKGTNDKQ